VGLQIVVLFAFIIMRMTGAVAFNPVFGHSNVPATIRGALVMVFSIMMYMWTGGTMTEMPGTIIEFSVMALKELFFGFVIGFGFQLAVMVIRYGTAIIDYTMGLSMAQVYDPQTSTQMTVSSQLYNAFMMLVFMAKDGHLRFMQIVFGAADTIPFGQVMLNLELPKYVIQYFAQCIVMGIQFAMPIIIIEMLIEVSVGLLMRVVPQINIFAVNFQIKIIVGLLMLLILFTPMSDVIDRAWSSMFDQIYQLVGLMTPVSQ
jgi:flagellar biosynthetic protein FliR